MFSLRVVCVWLGQRKGSEKRGLVPPGQHHYPTIVFLWEVHHLHINYVPILFALKSFLYLISDFLFPGSRPPLECFVFFEIVSQVPGKLRLEEELEETGTVEEQECGGMEASWGGGHVGCVYQISAPLAAEVREGRPAGGTQVGGLQVGFDRRSREWSFGGKKWKIHGLRLG